MNTSFSKALQNDKVVRFLSLISAIFFWFFITINVDKSEGTITIRNVPLMLDLELTTPEKYSLEIIDGMNQTFDIEVVGKRYIIGNLSGSDFIATPHLNSVEKSGEYEIVFEITKVDKNNQDYEVVSSYKMLDLKFDVIVEQKFQIVPQADGIIPIEGYIRDEIYVTPQTVTIEGPASEIAKIEAVYARNSDIQNLDETAFMPADILIYDSYYNTMELEYSDMDSQYFEICVPIYKTNTVPIKVEFINYPFGLDIDTLSYTLSTDAIKIAGQKELIENIQNLVVGPIDVRQIAVGSVIDLDINLLAGIINIDDTEKVQVHFNSEDMSSKTFDIEQEKILIQNAPGNYNIEVLSSAINDVIMVGNTEDIDVLISDDLFAIIDYSVVDLTMGSAFVPVSLYATGNKQVWALGEYKAYVNVTSN